MVASEVKTEPLASRQWAILMSLCGMAFCVVLDTSTVVTALPSIREDLGFSATGLHWVITGYALAFGGLMLLAGRLADYFGGRRTFLVGVAMFTAASLLCGLAWTPEVLVAARFAQGATGALVLPSALSIIMKVFEEGPRRNKALALWSSVGGLGGIVGFIVGGPLTDGPGWPWIFYMNVPIAVAVWFASLRLIGPDAPIERRGAFDFTGAATATGGLMLLVWSFSEIPNKGWGHPHTLLGVLGVVVAAAVFTAAETRSKSPLVPFRLFRNSTLSSGNIALFLAGFAQQGLWLVLSLHLQGVHGLSAVQFSALMLVPAAVGFGGVVVAQRLTLRFSIRSLVTVSMLGVGLAALPLTAISAEDASLPLIVVSVAVLGVFFGIAMVTCSIAALSGVDESDHGIASGVEESTYMIGGPLGVAAASTIIAWIAAGAPQALTAAEAAAAGHRWAIGVLAGAALLSPLITLPLMRGRGRFGRRSVG